MVQDSLIFHSYLPIELVITILIPSCKRLTMALRYNSYHVKAGNLITIDCKLCTTLLLCSLNNKENCTISNFTFKFNSPKEHVFVPNCIIISLKMFLVCLFW